MIIKQEIEIKNRTFELGTILALLSLGAINFIRLQMNQEMDYLTKISFLITFFLILNWDNILRLKLGTWNWKYAILFIIFIDTIFSATFEGYSFSGDFGTVYIYFGLAILIGMASNSRQLEEEFLLKMIYYVTGCLNIAALYVFSDGFTNTNISMHVVYSSNGVMIADRLTLTVIPSCFILVALVYIKKSSVKQRIINVLFWICAILNLFALHRRGTTIALLAGAFFSLYYKIDAIKPKKLLVLITKIIIVFGILYICYLKISFIRENVDSLFTSVQKAVLTLFGSDSMGRDSSAEIRLQLRTQSLEEYSNYGFFEIVFGKGYMYRYMDFPLFQAFIDGGILRGILFVIVQIVIPLKYILNQKANRLQQFINLNLICNIISLFYSGIPYGWSKYIYVIIAIYINNNEVKQPRKIRFQFGGRRI